MKEKPINLESIPAETAAVLKLLADGNNSAGNVLNDFLLIGGTAIAMRENHRLSIDIDFTTSGDKLDAKKIKSLIHFLAEKGVQVIDITDCGARDDFINDELDIEDYHQDWLINGVKVTFFTYRENKTEKEVIQNAGFSIFNGIKIADMHTLCLTKCHVLTKRTKSRDLFDIDMLIQNGYMSISDLIAEIQRTKPYLTYENIVDRLLWKPIQENDEGLHPVGVNATIESIRQNLAQYVASLNKQIFDEYSRSNEPPIPAC